MRAVAALLPPLILAAALAGCGSPCQDLADRICACQPAGSLRDSCASSVGNQIGGSGQHPQSADQKYCQSLLDGTATQPACPDPGKDSEACNFMQTPQGKVACGLSFQQ